MTKKKNYVIKKTYVIHVDEKNNAIKKVEKLEAHKKGILHRAFSIFIFNSKKDLLLQKRAKKYHTSFLWSNTCCSHPKNKDLKNLKKEAEKRLFEEMGIKCKLKEEFNIIYKAKLDNNLIENEYDHIFIGFSDEKPKINKKEVSDYKWISINELKKDIKKNKEKYTPWLRILIDDIKLLLNNYNNK